MQISIRAARATDAAAIAGIYNQGIEDRGATFETQLRTADDIAPTLSETANFPTLVAIDGDAVVGWAGLSVYRARACYAGIAEFSIYLDRTARGRGVGRQLLTSLIDVARDRGYWKLVSRSSRSTQGVAPCAARAGSGKSASTRNTVGSTVNGSTS